MFDFFGTIINKVALFVVAMVGFVIPGVGEPVVYETPPQDEVVVVPSISTTSPPSEQEELELLKEEAEAARAEAVEERLRAERAKGEAAAERGRAEKSRAEAETIRVDAERQRLQAEVDRLKAAAIATQEEKKEEPKKFTLPSGAILDEYGNVLNQAELDRKSQASLAEQQRRENDAKEKAIEAANKALLDKQLQEKQRLDQLRQALEEEYTLLVIERNQELEILKQEIDIYQAQYDKACEAVALAFCVGRREQLASQINPLVNEYNSLLSQSFTGEFYSSVQQTYLTFEVDSFGKEGRFYDPYSSLFQNFECDLWGNCSIQ